MTPAERLDAYTRKSSRFVVGLMSGTSVDGIDAALVRLSGSGRQTQAELKHFAALPWPLASRTQILELSHGIGNAEEVSRLNVEIAEQFAEAVALVAGTVSIDAIASHGQTVSHLGGIATLQLGSPAVLASRTGTLVVSDFRSADVALGGQGAPLVPYADWCLLTHSTKARAIQNIGGIGNVTYLPPDAAPEQVIGFDTGPGNMLIDMAAHWATDGQQAFDANGDLARQGAIDFDVLEWLVTHPFLKLPPPKSAGREEFGQTLFKTLLARTASVPWQNILAALTEFTAISIADAYQRYLPALPDEVIVGGGGARNRYLMERIAERLPGIAVRTHEEVGLNGDAKEALAFTLLANETLLGNPANLPSVTGASRATLLGSVTFPG
ncbi:MAG: anhydro-N-acetylmuramic acid kinase [Armatimonas sp.]